MKKVPVVITLATLYAIFFQVAIYTDMSEDIIFAMFFFSPIVVIYMAYTILRYGKPSGHTFEERFYDDWDHKKETKKK